MQRDLFIGNEFAPAASGRRFAVVNPATEEPLAEVAEGGEADIARAVAAARDCFESDGWQGLSPRKRGALIHKAADLLAARLKEVAELETRQNGKPLFESKIDVAMTIETLQYYGGWADKIRGETSARGGWIPQLHAARAAGRRRRDRAVELPAQAGGVEGRARAGVAGTPSCSSRRPRRRSPRWRWRS